MLRVAVLAQTAVPTIAATKLIVNIRPTKHRDLIKYMGNTCNSCTNLDDNLATPKRYCSHG